MVQKRSRPEEILEWRSRLHPSGERWEALRPQFDVVESLTWTAHKTPEALGEHAYLIVQHLVVLAVACHQTFYRLLVRDIVNSRPDARGRLGRLRDLRFDIADVLAVGDRAVSPGELVAHLLPLKDFTKASEIISILIDQDYTKRILEADVLGGFPPEIRAQAPVGPEPLSLRRGDIAEMVMSELETLFRIRHIIAHEISLGLPRLEIPRVAYTLHAANSMLMVMQIDSAALIAPRAA